MNLSSSFGMEPPYREKMVDQAQLISSSWQAFVRWVYETLSPLGREKSFSILNNQSMAINIDGLQFNSARTNHVRIKYVVQRVTTGGSSVELLETGELHAVYLPKTESWDLRKAYSSGPHNSGVTFSMSADGQVKYASTNVGGVPAISKCSFRAETIEAKYSKGAL